MPNSQADVTAGAPNLENYTDNGDGTVIDNVTGLVWQQTFPSGTYEQTAAITYCASLNLGGYGDWRLPSLVELLSILDTDVWNPSLNTTYFPGPYATPYFWTSTPYAAGGGSAWVIYFVYGTFQTYPTSTPYAVRCVR